MDNTGFDGVLIADALEEDADGNADHFLWNTSALSEGKYFIYAMIFDENNSYRIYANEPFTIKHNNKDRD